MLTPYRGVRYHLNEYSSQNPPRNAKELYNLRHSSLRNGVERAFGILKGRFRAIDAKPFWSYKTQVDVVLACCILHNLIMGLDPNDYIAQQVTIESQSNTQRIYQSQREEREESREWATIRDVIANQMWDDYDESEYA